MKKTTTLIVTFLLTLFTITYIEASQLVKQEKANF